MTQSNSIVPNSFASKPTNGLTKAQIREAFLRRPPNMTVTLIKSPFANREPWVYFPYPAFLGKKRPLPED